MPYYFSMLAQLSPSTTLWYLVQLASVLGSAVAEVVALAVAVPVTEVTVLFGVPIQTATSR
jgi:hypothetical protein